MAMNALNKGDSTMSELHPIVYTRPFAENDDFRFFARPASLVGDVCFVERMRNVMATEGYRGSIKGRRWHVLRRRNTVVIGLATQEFERFDMHGRRLRGYYGFEMPVTDVCLPSFELFHDLDDKVVEPLFRIKNIQERDFGVIRGASFDNPEMYRPITGCSGKYNFNTDRQFVNYIPIGVPEEDLLKEALGFAVNNESFECVIGLNSRKHAEVSQVQNCQCYEQATALCVRVCKRDSNVDPKEEVRVISNISRGNNSNIPSDRPESFARKCGRGLSKGVRMICSVFTSGSDELKRVPQPAMKELPKEPIDAVCGTVDSSPVSNTSIFESHSRGWNIARPKAKMSSDISGCDTKCEARHEGKGENMMIPDLVEKLVVLHSQWYRLAKGNDVQLDICCRIADILRRCEAEQIIGESFFDPERHIDENNSNAEMGAVISETLVPGWSYGGRILQKSLVRTYEQSSDKEIFGGVFSKEEIIKEL